MLNLRQQRRERVAQAPRTRCSGRTRVVQSRSGHGKYRVTFQRKEHRRTCADFQFRGQKCRHIFAVEVMVVCFRTVRFFGLSSGSLSG